MAGLLIKKTNEVVGSKAQTLALTAIAFSAPAPDQSKASGLWMMGFRRMGFY
jgi:hypothetical protein